MFDEIEIIEIQFNGNEYINLYFIGDGFTESEQNDYHNKVNDAITALFNKEPFDAHQDKFNIYSIPTISNESGISTINHPSNPVTEDLKDTFLGSYRNRDGLIRYTDFFKKTELREYFKNKSKKKTYLCVIANATYYGGSGDLPDYTFMPTTHVMLDEQYNTFGNLFIHELGHAFGGLADEYGGDCTGSGLPDFDEVLYDRPNVTKDNVNDRKWDYLPDPQYILGANYCNTEWYRSTQDSLMRSWFEPGNADEEFNQVSKDALVNRINDEIAINSRISIPINDKVIVNILEKANFLYNLKKQL